MFILVKRTPNYVTSIMSGIRNNDKESSQVFSQMTDQIFVDITDVCLKSWNLEAYDPWSKYVRSVTLYLV